LHPFRLNNARKKVELIRFSFPLLIGIVMTMIIKYAGILMLGRDVGPKAVGIYDVGNTLSLLLLFPLSGLEFVFLPIAGTLHSRNQSFELVRTYQVLTKWIFSVTTPIFFVLFLFPGQVITTLFSDRFTDAAPALRILCCGYLFHSFWGPNGIIMVVIGMSHEILYVSTFGGVANIVLNYLFISQFKLEIVGAATACVLTYVSLNILVSILIYKKSGAHPFTKNYFKAIICAAFMGLCIFFASSFLNLHWIFLFFYFSIFIVGYGFLIFITKSIDAEDISIFMTFVEMIKTKGRTLKSTIGKPYD
jgi:O-antigen/teichoic acid export membrane protein